MLNRVVVASLLVIALLCGIFHFAGTLWALNSHDWIDYTPHGDQGLSGHRGLKQMCLADTCTELNLDAEAVQEEQRSVINLRKAAIFLLQASLGISAFAYVAGTVLFCVLLNRDQARKISLLLIGIVVWIAAVLVYNGAIAFLEQVNQESYKMSFWTKEVREQTKQELGIGYKITLASTIVEHIGGFLLMAISMRV